MRVPMATRNLLDTDPLQGTGCGNFAENLVAGRKATRAG